MRIFATVTFVYSTLVVVGPDAARPMVLIREMDYEWWGGYV